MLETYDPKWAEKWDRAKAEYDRLLTIPFLERSGEDCERIDNLSKVMGLAFIDQFKTPDAYIRLHYDMVFKAMLLQYGEVMDCPTLPDDAGYDAAHEIVTNMSARIEHLRQAAWLADIAAKQAENQAAKAEPDAGVVIEQNRRGIFERGWEAIKRWRQSPGVIIVSDRDDPEYWTDENPRPW
jgi:hypothetical protein